MVMRCCIPRSFCCTASRSEVVSAIDWSRPVDLQKFPKWSRMRGFEVILEPGDALYIPSFWLHYIVSLGTNFQCNARSGHSEASHEDLRVCGF